MFADGFLGSFLSENILNFKMQAFGSRNLRPHFGFFNNKCFLPRQFSVFSFLLAKLKI